MLVKDLYILKLWSIIMALKIIFSSYLRPTDQACFWLYSLSLYLSVSQVSRGCSRDPEVCWGDRTFQTA